jgi:hypothetical protein
MVYINDIYRKTPPEPEQKNKNKGGGTKAFVTFVLILIILYLGYILIKSLDLKPIDENTKINNIEQSPEPSKTSAATASPTPEPSKTVEATATAQTVEKSSISIKVLNGSGVNNAATNIEKELEKQGFTVSAIGTAKNPYTQSVIYYKTDADKSKAQLVKDSLTSISCTLQKSSIADKYDVLVVVGKK